MADKVDRTRRRSRRAFRSRRTTTRERLRIYQIIHATVSQVREKAQTLRGASVDEAGLDSSVSALYRSYANNSIFLTRDLEQRLHDLWAHSLTVLRGDRVSKADAEKIVEGIVRIEEQMRRDLLIDELTADQKLLQQPVAAPGR